MPAASAAIKMPYADAGRGTYSRERVFESILVERRRFCVSKKVRLLEAMGLLRSRHTKKEPNGSLFVCQTASGMRSHVTFSCIRFQHSFSRFNTASGMRSHVTLCLGGRRNRRLKSGFWKTSSKPNVRSHFFSCHYIPREYVMTPPSLI